MFSKQDLSKLYDALLATPGMQETVKMDLRLQRKNVLLLSKIIQRGLKREATDKEEDILLLYTKENSEEIEKLVEELLLKAGLKDLYEKLGAFS